MRAKQSTVSGKICRSRAVRLTQTALGTVERQSTMPAVIVHVKQTKRMLREFDFLCKRFDCEPLELYETEFTETVDGMRGETRVLRQTVFELLGTPENLMAVCMREMQGCLPRDNPIAEYHLPLSVRVPWQGGGTGPDKVRPSKMLKPGPSHYATIAETAAARGLEATVASMDAKEPLPMAVETSEYIDPSPETWWNGDRL